MDDVVETAPELDRTSDAQRAQRMCLKIAFLACALWGFLRGVLPEASFAVYFLDHVLPWGPLVLAVFWCHYDSIQRDIYITRNQYILFCLFFPVAFWVYVFRTRGWRGFRTLLIFVGLAALYLLCLFFTLVVGLLISGKDPSQLTL